MPSRRDRTRHQRPSRACSAPKSRAAREALVEPTVSPLQMEYPSTESRCDITSCVSTTWANHPGPRSARSKPWSCPRQRLSIAGNRLPGPWKTPAPLHGREKFRCIRSGNHGHRVAADVTPGRAARSGRTPADGVGGGATVFAKKNGRVRGAPAARVRPLVQEHAKCRHVRSLGVQTTDPRRESKITGRSRPFVQPASCAVT